MLRFSNLAVVLAVTSALIIACHALCSHPCSRVNKGTFTNGRQNFVFGCQNSSVLQVIDRSTNQFIEDRECYARSGPFLVFRVGNRYQCFKDTVYDRRTRVVMIYFAPPRTYSTNPSICDVCSGPYTFALFVADGEMSLDKANKLKRPELGCNKPPNCPLLTSSDVECTGCEKKEDDGLCCSSCRRGYGRG